MKSFLKKIIISTLCLTGSVMMSGCDLSNMFANKERTVNDAVDDVTDSLVITSEGYFKNDRTYNANGDGMSYVLSFSKSGDLNIKDLSDNTVVEYNYKIYDNLIEVIVKDINVVFTYIDYCEDIIFIPAHVRSKNNYKYFNGGLVGVLEGVVASERGKSIIGYHTELVVKKGDLPAVLTGDKDSKGYSYAIYKNGTWKSDKPYKYLKSDAIASSDFNTEEVGTKLVNVTIASKTYKVPFVVWDEVSV